MADRERAKSMIVEIIRQAGGELTGTTRLFKAFYFAHLYYAEKEPGYLSDWPIVKMPNGPGIDSFRGLVSELVDADVVATEHTPVGPYQSVRYRLSDGEYAVRGLSDEAIRAIQQGAQLVVDKTATELSEMTHEFSRSWNLAQEGQELNIYLDLIPEDEYEQRRKGLESLKKELESAWD